VPGDETVCWRPASGRLDSPPDSPPIAAPAVIGHACLVAVIGALRLAVAPRRAERRHDGPMDG
jgi:hypothetical protein